MKKKRFNLLSLIFIQFIVFFTMGCSFERTTTDSSYVTIPVRDFINNNDDISAKDEIKSIEYIPLVLTDDDQSMIGQVMDVSLTDNFIFILSDPTCGLLQFDRTGKFIRKIARYGQGPGELLFPISIYCIESKNLLYVTGAYKTTIYDLEGKLKEEFNRGGRMSFYSYPIENSKVVETSFDGIPFKSDGHFGIGVFDAMGKGDTVMMKNDFANENIFKPEESGFKLTRCIQSDMGVLFSTITNDTIFRITENKICPAFIWQRDLNEKSMKNSYALVGFDPINTDLFLYDMIEFPKNIYFRYVYKGRTFLMSYNKQTGQVLSTPCYYSWNDITGIDFWMTMWGIDNDIDNGLPIAPLHWYKDKKISIQCTQASAVAFLKENGKLDLAPNALKNIKGEENPIVVLYHLN